MALSLAHMDAETAALTLELLRGDVDEILDTRKGKQRDDAIDDSKTALDVIKADLEATATINADKAMARSIAQAVHQDCQAISAAQVQEKQAADDRQAALQFNRNGRLNPAPPKRGDDAPPPYEANGGNKFFDKLEAQYNISPQLDNDNDTTQAESSSWAAGRRVAKPRGILEKPKPRQCASCMDDFPLQDLAKFPCSHEYCRACLETMLTGPLTDEGLWPPRCCQQRVDPEQDQIRILVDARLMGQYLARKLEMETPNRTYCHVSDCSKFIPPKGIHHDIGTCPKCEAKTCCTCKAAAHEGEDCPKDEAGKQLLDLAKKQGWRQCFACKRVVELKEGCNHMTCRCGAQFCYKCGAAWKNRGQPGACACELFDEAVLLRQATQVAARNPQFLQQPEARRADLVQREVHRIVENHDCIHARWRHAPGPDECDLCDRTMKNFILVCRECELAVCSRCKRNRL
ncbi:hypothetical protein diail_11136 [Diaporthe ilicicola]|nr:hypothetical protein diail_11136 [Diaporthe ilicicola]